LLALAASLPGRCQVGEARDYPIRPVPFTVVRVSDAFWSPRLETSRSVTIPHALDRCERTGRVENFAVAAGLAPGVFQGRFGFDDSDVYKVIEGASYALALHGDPILERRLDEIISKIAAAQARDGYLYTVGMIGKTAVDPFCCVSRTRWSDMAAGHELYDSGHLFEAAVAHYQATGKRSLLDVALRNANLLARVFGPAARLDVPGHQEVELGLVKLYRVSGEQRYLDLARFFLDQRANAEGHGCWLHLWGGAAPSAGPT